MISLRVTSAAAVMAVVLPLVAPTASLAGGKYAGKVGGGGAPGVRFSGGGAPAARFSGGGAAWHGGGGYAGGYRRGGGGFVAGAVAGAVIGGAIAAQPYGYYGGPGYYSEPGYYAAPGYTDEQYYDDGAVAVVPAPVGGDGVAYCMQTYRSYNPRTGTYLGYDGMRYRCP
jgi:BA14K-like protein